MGIAVREMSGNIAGPGDWRGFPCIV